MKHTYTKRDFHNPEQLTRQQVGAEFRLLLPEEVDGRVCERLYLADAVGELYCASFSESPIYTYRVPLATPLPDGTILSSNECCFADDPQKPRCYCAGPMRNLPDWNFHNFFAAAAFMRLQGYEAINPAQLDCDSGFPLERLKQLTPTEFQEFLKGAMKRDLEAIQGCDALVLLPGWESSKGARAEKAVAEWGGKRIGYLWSERGDGFRLTWENEKQPLPYNSDERAEWDVDKPSQATTAPLHPNDPKGAAGALKAPMWLLPASALQQTAWVHGLGSKKYRPYNWRETGVCATTYISAIMRHLDQWRDGEDIDKESGKSHIAHIAASCNILMDAQHCGKLNDDRNKTK
jgi:hypothetical protein